MKFQSRVCDILAATRALIFRLCTFTGVHSILRLELAESVWLILIDRRHVLHFCVLDDVVTVVLLFA